MERKISALCRAVAVRVAENQVVNTDAPNSEKQQEENATPPSFPIVIDESAVEDILGVSLIKYRRIFMILKKRHKA